MFTDERAFKDDKHIKQYTCKGYSLITVIFSAVRIVIIFKLFMADFKKLDILNRFFGWSLNEHSRLRFVAQYDKNVATFFTVNAICILPEFFNPDLTYMNENITIIICW